MSTEIESLRERVMVDDETNSEYTLTGQQVEELFSEIAKLRADMESAHRQAMMDSECIERMQNVGAELEVTKQQLAESQAQAAALREVMKEAFIEGYDDGYSNGSSDAASFDCGSPISRQRAANERKDAWKHSESAIRASLGKDGA